MTTDFTPEAPHTDYVMPGDRSLALRTKMAGGCPLAGKTDDGYSVEKWEEAKANGEI